MTGKQKILAVGLVLALVASATLPALLKGAESPAAQQAKTQAELTALINKLRDVDEQISKIMPTQRLLASEEFRKGDGQKMIPLLKKALPLMDEIEQSIRTDPRMRDELSELADQVHAERYHMTAFGGMLGDAEQTAFLEEKAKAKNSDGTLANASQLMARWAMQSNSAEEQAKVLSDFSATAKANNKNLDILGSLAWMANVGPANNETAKKLIEFIRTNMQGDDSQMLLSQLDNQQERLAIIGKPLDIKGRTTTGSSFSLEQYKGKVVLIDFWATWCGPCIRELPNVKATYETFHDKGFEIVGVDCDDSDDTVNAFIKEQKMPWIQLREKSQNERSNWHPLTKTYHVDGIPTMFLVDKDGILRDVEAREDLNGKVKKLLEK